MPAGEMDLPVDVSKLINAIYVSLYAPKWFGFVGPGGGPGSGHANSLIIKG